MMNDALAGMIPYDSIGLYEQPKPRFIFKMPRVVPEQKSKFESDELFRRLSRDSEVGDTQLTNFYRITPFLGMKIAHFRLDFVKIYMEMVFQFT